MAGHSRETGTGETKQNREVGADYYLGLSEESLGGEAEKNIPYKLEPNATEIEDFLTRLRQEGL